MARESSAGLDRRLKRVRGRRRRRRNSRFWRGRRPPQIADWRSGFRDLKSAQRHITQGKLSLKFGILSTVFYVRKRKYYQGSPDCPAIDNNNKILVSAQNHTRETIPRPWAIFGRGGILLKRGPAPFPRLFLPPSRRGRILRPSRTLPRCPTMSASPHPEEPPRIDEDAPDNDQPTTEEAEGKPAIVPSVPANLGPAC